MEQHTPVCAKPTRKYPNGRTGTDAGYQAHRKAGGPACRACLDAVNERQRPFRESNREHIRELRRKRDAARSPGERDALLEARRAYHKEWYAETIEQRREYRRKSYDPEKARDKYMRRRAVIDEAKDKPCMDCGVKYPSYVMQFDHRDPATKSFGIGPRGTGRSVEALLAEIAKCDVVCANCHAERTHQQRLKRRKEATADAADRACGGTSSEAGSPGNAAS